MKDKSLKVGSMVMEELYLIMGLTTKENIKMIIERDLDLTFLKMEIYILVKLNRVILMVKVNIIGLMVSDMKENIKMT